MITSKLQGGLGNQMFQISAAYSLSKDLGVECGFDFEQCHTPAQGNTSNKYKDNVLKKIKNISLDFKKFKQYSQKQFSYTEIPKNDNLILNGDFQSEKYFNKYKDDVKALFYCDDDKIKEIGKRLSGFDIVTSIHVRRGDYLNKPNFHTSCGIEYYKKAISLIGGGDFIFVSDDIDWCKNNFKGPNIHYSPFTNEVDDLYLMVLCDNQIIANSSFSWWGGYLCTYHNNIVICPKNWFGPKGPKDTQDIYLNNWLKI
jgi:hypothetical protein